MQVDSNNQNNQNQIDEKLKKLNFLIQKLKELEKEKNKILKELENKKKLREEINKILKQDKEKQFKKIKDLEQKIIYANNLFKKIKFLIIELQKLQSEQEQILKEISTHPILNSPQSLNNSFENEKNQILSILFELQKEMLIFKNKRIEIEKKIDQLKQL